MFEKLISPPLLVKLPRLGKPKEGLFCTEFIETKDDSWFWEGNPKEAVDGSPNEAERLLRTFIMS